MRSQRDLKEVQSLVLFVSSQFDLVRHRSGMRTLYLWSHRRGHWSLDLLRSNYSFRQSLRHVSADKLGSIWPISLHRIEAPTCSCGVRLISLSNVRLGPTKQPLLNCKRLGGAPSLVLRAQNTDCKLQPQQCAH